MNSECTFGHIDQSAKPTDLKMICLTFERGLVFRFYILHLECAHRWIGDSVLAEKSTQNVYKNKAARENAAA